MSIDKNGMSELLSNYLSYKQAIYNYEHYKPFPSAGTANYSGLPSGSGAPERFFAEVGKRADMGLTSALDQYDHDMYSAIVHLIEFTVSQVLNDDERFVITHKYLQRNGMNLSQIADFKDKGESTIRRWHKQALKKLVISFGCLHKVPQIENFEKSLTVSGF